MKNPHAVELGRLGGKIGGKVKSDAKTAAARLNATKPRPNRKKSKTLLGLESVS